MHHEITPEQGGCIILAQTSINIFLLRFEDKIFALEQRVFVC